MRRKTPRQTGDHSLPPVDATGAEGLTRVEACLHVGDFPAATHAWHALEAGGWLARVSGLPRADLTRLRTVATAAELAFDQGRPQEAQAALADYLAHPEDFLAPDNGLSVHAKLQLAEWYYARRESAIAVHLAERLLAACEPERYAAEGHVPARYASVRPYLEDLGELHYYLARFYSRLHRYTAVDQQCDQALEAFARAALLDPGAQEPLTIRWRIGLILMVAGFTQWRAGSLAKATSQLQTAKWLLHPTQDAISQANVEQYLGCLQRSQGQYAAAVASLERARDIYRREHHPRELSRVQTELGRTYLEQGADDQADASLGEALAFARRTQQVRDEVESLVCLSWLYQRRGPEQLEVAAGYAARALACKVADGEVLGIEAKLALGHCRLRQGRYAEAKNNLEVALANAAAMGIATHQISAHLALAELFVAPSVKDLSSALHHYRQADTLLVTTASPPLQRVARRVKHTLDASQGELLVIRADDLWACGLKATEQRLQIWAIERALQQAQGRKSDIARRLRLSRPGLAKMWARLFAHEPSGAPEPPPG
jgi:tetratricopeptide (TPR) repeat protein